MARLRPRGVNTKEGRSQRHLNFTSLEVDRSTPVDGDAVSDRRIIPIRDPSFELDVFNRQVHEETRAGQAWAPGQFSLPTRGPASKRAVKLMGSLCPIGVGLIQSDAD